MSNTVNLMWHRIGPTEKRGTAPWKLTSMDGRTVYGRVQYQDGNWQGQVIVNSLPADWRRSNRGISYPSAWHNKRADAFDSVETFLSASVRSIFKAEELSFLTWDDDDNQDPPPKPDTDDRADKLRGLMPKSIIGDELKHDFDKYMKSRQAQEQAERERKLSDYQREALHRIMSFDDAPRPLSIGDNEMLKKYGW
jgi:hypothetical protein